MTAKALTTTWFLLLLHQGLPSPVYNMQPAFITANIGTVGRNIRHLPCVSRKSGLTGTCMFAIDCLKANGTHLGTCIDRFYFGSCCHMEPYQDIDNVIDTALIPVRQPPFRLSSTTEKLTTQKEKIPVTFSIIDSLNSITSSATTIGTTIIGASSSTEMITTLTSPSVSSFSLSTIASPTTNNIGSSTVETKKPIATTTQQSTRESIATTEKLTTAELKTTVSTTQKAVPVKTTTEIPVTTESIRLSTFQSVENSDTTYKTTFKPTKLTQKPTKSTTARPTTQKVTTPKITTQKGTTQKVSTQSRPRPRPTSKPTTQKVTQKPNLKPQRTTTKGTVKPTSKPTGKPLIKPTSKPTNKPINKPTKGTVKPIRLPLKTTPKPTTIATTTEPTTTTERFTTTRNVFTTSRTTPTPKTTPSKPTTLLVTESPTTISTKLPVISKLPEVTIPETTPSQSNEILASTKVPVVETVNGNTATNEIEPELQPVLPIVMPVLIPEVEGPVTPEVQPVVKPDVTEGRPEIEVTVEMTTQPAQLVTWAMINETPSNQSSEVPENEDWVPITTPDGWVLLPSVSTVTQPGETIQPSSTLTQSQTTAPSIPTSNITSTASIQTTTAEGAVTANWSAATTEGGVTDNVVTEFGNTTNENGTIVPLVPLLTIPPQNGSATKPTNLSDYTDVCGRRMYPEARIVGGEKSQFGRWPWQISLRQWKTSTYLHKCGAALLNENWAITAAHCVDNVPPSDLLLRLGEHDLSTDSEPHIHQERRVQIVASHPQFDPRTFEYDLALLRFYEPVTFQPNIVPVCVPQTDENFVGRTAYVTGWGRLYEDGPLPSILQQVTVPVIENSVCESMYRNAGYIEHIPNIFICAGWRRGGFDSCEGDSGGPMVIQRKDRRFLLAGIISWGIGCAEPNQPGVYTRISEFRDWINQILQF